MERVQIHQLGGTRSVQQGVKVRLPRQSRVEKVTANVDLPVDYLTGAMPAGQRKSCKRIQLRPATV